MASQEELARMWNTPIPIEVFREYIALNEEVKKERMYGDLHKIYTPTQTLDASKKVQAFIDKHDLLRRNHALWATLRTEGTEAEKIAFYEMMARHGSAFGYNNCNYAQNLVIFDHIPRLLERVESLEKRLAVYEEKERLEQEKARRQEEEERLAKAEADAKAEEERQKPFLQRLRSFF
jgi:hypothetical protein